MFQAFKAKQNLGVFRAVFKQLAGYQRLAISAKPRQEAGRNPTSLPLSWRLVLLCLHHNCMRSDFAFEESERLQVWTSLCSLEAPFLCPPPLPSCFRYRLFLRHNPFLWHNWSSTLCGRQQAGLSMMRADAEVNTQWVRLTLTPVPALNVIWVPLARGTQGRSTSLNPFLRRSRENQMAREGNTVLLAGLVERTVSLEGYGKARKKTPAGGSLWSVRTVIKVFQILPRREGPFLNPSIQDTSSASSEQAHSLPGLSVFNWFIDCLAIVVVFVVKKHPYPTWGCKSQMPFCIFPGRQCTVFRLLFSRATDWSSYPSKQQLTVKKLYKNQATSLV